ncbi:MAG: O-methyltransferase [Planctomycetes bacterium]|nr:O-methyltransferase [Planctomycetota bacterium]
MSEHTDPVSHALVEYIGAHAPAEGAFLAELRAAAHAAGLPQISIAAEQAQFMRILLQLHGARQVLEVGTLGGYSAIAMARGLPADGKLITVEVEPAHAEFAKTWIARSDVADRIEVRTGRGIDVLPTLPDASADAAFLDADKVSYAAYLPHCLRIVRSGGVILVDNAFAFGHLLDPKNQEPSVSAIRAFNETVARHPELDGVLVPLGDGLWVARRK